MLSWRAAGQERLFLPDAAVAKPGSAVRGGIPVIFPQFADLGPGPRHGFARTTSWTAFRPTERPDAATAGMRLTSAQVEDPRWPHAFSLELSLALTADSLEISLEAENCGQGSWSFTAALHSYLAVQAGPALPDTLRLHPFQDRSGSGCRSPAAGPLDREAEIERLYRNVPEQLDWQLPDTLRMHSDGWPDLMIWNPGREKAAALPDLAPGDHRRFLCVEPLQSDPVKLPPGDRWRARHRLQLSGR